MTDWVSSESVSGWLRAQPATGGTAAAATAADIEHAVAAVNSWMVRTFGGRVTPADGAEDTQAHQALGALMLAARLVRRRNSPEGVQAVTELGPVYVSRNDPDVALLLGLDLPKVG